MLNAQPGRRFGFRPESAQLAGDGVVAVVKHATYLGSKVELQVETPTGEILKLWTREMMPQGEILHFQVATGRLIVL
jgi:hypothetical protein